MGNGLVKKVKYFTEEKKRLINPDNLALYEKYLKSSIIKNKDVANTTYKVYQNYMTHFLVYLAEEWNNVGLYDEEFFENALDIMEGFIAFCQDTLLNNKKVINTKIATVSSFYLWSLKRGSVERHPFDKKLDRMKEANEQKIINSYFLTDEEIKKIDRGLQDAEKFDIQDKILWNIMIDSANRIGAISKLKLSNMNLKDCVFTDVREKRGKLVEVAFSEKTKKLIQQWLDMRKDIDDLKIDALFIAKYKGEYSPMGMTTLQRRITKMGTIVELKDFHAHCIRKTTLNNIVEKTGRIEIAAELANHKSIETTKSHYVKPKSKTELRDTIKNLMNKNNRK